MGKRKAISLLKRSNASKDRPTNEKQKHKKQKSATSNPPNRKENKPIILHPTSEILRQAAYAVSRLLHADATSSDGASLKSLTLAPHINNKKAVYAVTIETLKYVPVLEQLVQRTQLLEKSSGLTMATAFVLIRELLWSSEGLQPTGPAEKAIIHIKNDIQSSMKSILEENNTEDVTELLPSVKLAAIAAQVPRTARVNELKMTVQQALDWLKSPPNPHSKWAKVGRDVTIDTLLPDVLIFPPGADLHDHPLVAQGALILQSKASCMPARALMPRSEWKIIDACAAPGNKTTHLAAISRPRKIIAFDKDPNRLQRLIKNAKHTGADGFIEARRADFLTINQGDIDHEYDTIDAILLDPSCSGSGTVFSRMDHLLPSAASKSMGRDAIMYKDARIESLAAFQTLVLRHALTKFPNVKKLVYSTCSLHAVENECVVANVLDDARAHGFELITALPEWHRRGVGIPGVLDEKEARKLVRTDPLEDHTDGFFVALFERKKKMKGKEGKR